MVMMIAPEGWEGQLQNQWGTFTAINGEVDVPLEAVIELRAEGFIVKGGHIDQLRQRAAALETRVTAVEQSGGGGGPIDINDLVAVFEQNLA